MISVVVFSLDGLLYGLPLASVERILPAVEVTPLPKAPAVVVGVINLGGRILPVVNVRDRFGLPEKGMELGDHLILSRAGSRPVALVVDEVCGVVERPEEDLSLGQAILPGAEYLRGVARLEDGMILICDLLGFLSWDEEKLLDEALVAEATLRA